MSGAARNAAHAGLHSHGINIDRFQRNWLTRYLMAWPTLVVRHRNSYINAILMNDI